MDKPNWDRANFDERKRASNDTTLGEAIQRLLQVYRLDAKLNEMNVLDQWEEMFGKAVAARTESLKIMNKVLYVKLNSSVMREELMFGKKVIILRINEKAGAEIITDVWFG
jgi:predicted nucleic acid-binding Zn ribbon protein